MSGDVRAALEAACWAACGAEEPGKIVRRFVGDVPTEMPLWMAQMEDVSAAIAAFLRALKITAIQREMPYGTSFRSGPNVGEEIAAAVTSAAAREGSEGNG